MRDFFQKSREGKNSSLLGYFENERKREKREFKKKRLTSNARTRSPPRASIIVCACEYRSSFFLARSVFVFFSFSSPFFRAREKKNIQNPKCQKCQKQSEYSLFSSTSQKSPYKQHARARTHTQAQHIAD